MLCRGVADEQDSAVSEEVDGIKVPAYRRSVPLRPHAVYPEVCGVWAREEYRNWECEEMNLIDRIREARTQLRHRSILPLTENHLYLCFLSDNDMEWCRSRVVPSDFGSKNVEGLAGCLAMGGPKCLTDYVIGKIYEEGSGRTMITGIRMLPGDEE